MRKARLIVTWQCNKSCARCCNKTLPYEPIKISEKDLITLCKIEGYFSEVIITGGEPLLFPKRLKRLIKQIPRSQRRILYTAEPYPSLDCTMTGWLEDSAYDKLDVLEFFDGITITVHEQDDAKALENLLSRWGWFARRERTIRINIFDDIVLRDSIIKELRTRYFAEISNKVWMEDCPIPKDETLFVLDKPWRKTPEDKCRQ